MIVSYNEMPKNQKFSLIYFFGFHPQVTTYLEETYA